MITQDIKIIERRALDAVKDIMRASLLSRLTVVDSPPGAGKTWLVEQAIAFAVTQGFDVCCLAPRASQGYDIVRRLNNNFALPRIQLLVAKDRTVPPDIGDRVDVITDVSSIGHGPGVIVSTAEKVAVHLQEIPTDRFGFLVIDEAYQLAYKQFIPVASMAPRILMVGDPGQLPPVIPVDTTDFEGADFKVHWPAPKELLHRYPETPQFSLMATRRFLQDTVDILQPSLYPLLPFLSAVDPIERRLHFRIGGVLAQIDQALDMISSGSTIVGLVLPYLEGGLPEVDDELSQVMARVVDRFVERQPEWVGKRMLGIDDIGCIDKHVQSGGKLRELLRASGHDRAFVNTPEIWQGLQKPVTVVKHPLSGISRPGPFDLEPGRLCVMLSRHQHGTIMVGRENISYSINDYEHDCGQTACGAEDMTWRGYKAHSDLWKWLEKKKRLLRF